MKVELLQTLTGVREFALWNGELFYQSAAQKLISSDQVLEDRISSFMISKNRLLYNFDDLTLKLKELPNGETKLISNAGITQNRVVMPFMIAPYFESNRVKYTVVNLEDGKKTETIAGLEGVIVAFPHMEYLFVLESPREIAKIHLPTGQLIWSTLIIREEVLKDKTFIDIGGGRIRKIKVQKILGVFRNNLYVATSRELLAINSEDGEVYKLWREFPQETLWDDIESFQIPLPHQSVLDQSNGHILGYNGSCYWEIDVLHDKMTIEKLKDHYSEHNMLRPSSSHIYHCKDSLLFCVQSTNKSSSGFSHYLISFEVGSKRMEVLHEFILPAGQFLRPQTLQIHNRKLYLGSTDRQLFIFQIIEG